MAKYLETKTGSLEEAIKQVNEKSVSQAQQQAAGAALAAKRGEIPVSQLQGASKEMYDGMTEKELEDFAKTKHKGLPKKVEELDPVDPKAVKKKFDDRKDKDIDNDGDVDSTDKYLHKRRKAISKAIAKEEVELEEGLSKSQIDKLKAAYSTVNKVDPTGPAYKRGKEMLSKLDKNSLMSIAKAKIKFLSQMAASELSRSHDVKLKAKEYMESVEDIKEYNEIGTPEYTKHTLDVTPGQSEEDWEKQVGVMQQKTNTMREALAKVWGMKEGKNPFKKEEEEKPLKKTMTGEKPTKVEIQPKIKD